MTDVSEGFTAKLWREKWALTDAHMPDFSGFNYCTPYSGFRFRVDGDTLIHEPIPADDFYASDVQFAQDQVEITIEEAEKRGIPIGSAGYVWVA